MMMLSCVQKPRTVLGMVGVSSKNTFLLRIFYHILRAARIPLDRADNVACLPTRSNRFVYMEEMDSGRDINFTQIFEFSRRKNRKKLPSGMRIFYLNDLTGGGEENKQSVQNMCQEVPSPLFRPTKEA